MQKKGAIEFSMTTIMVIIIGVAVLALGLAWVRGTFKSVSTLTESSLDNAETILGEVGFTGKIGAPATIIMEKSDAKKYRVYLRNTDTAIPKVLEVTPNFKSSSGITCFTLFDTPQTLTIVPGDTTEFGGGIVSNNCNSGDSGVITITANEGANTYASEAIAVRVE
ncbi:hypothetical protein HYT56_02645 [Candidatus Woesearchaeota archaeon]|nr:hypothetical protein [Candidatus Woesearchaeota archaeon]